MATLEVLEKESIKPYILVIPIGIRVAMVM
jgi:hypothetical protein